MRVVGVAASSNIEQAEVVAAGGAGQRRGADLDGAAEGAPFGRHEINAQPQEAGWI